MDDRYSYVNNFLRFWKAPAEGVKVILDKPLDKPLLTDVFSPSKDIPVTPELLAERRRKNMVYASILMAGGIFIYYKVKRKK